MTVPAVTTATGSAASTGPGAFDRAGVGGGP